MFYKLPLYSLNLLKQTAREAIKKNAQVKYHVSMVTEYIVNTVAMELLDVAMVTRAYIHILNN